MQMCPMVILKTMRSHRLLMMFKLPQIMTSCVAFKVLKPMNDAFQVWKLTVKL